MYKKKIQQSIFDDKDLRHFKTIVYLNFTIGSIKEFELTVNANEFIVNANTIILNNLQTKVMILVDGQII